LPFFVVRVVANPLLLKKAKENKKALQVENDIEKNSSKEINIDRVNSLQLKCMTRIVNLFK
jgi:hypothetical protein